ncbi:pyridoxamine 5'-phosphate oxidase family protein [Lewinella sp. JB7]|uniref:pyridoxamine 5'-phosphate oxidase family protein n=1 Tax=Lewinella sp. JB7 TaxID=2962887 RepID=UPI0020C94CC6|nr:pyridoxamine 5'-phosphate oxidase family protein [Lewinella sp. JB7]MCP9236696.1 pyridoxamine 5'-phosphate oxidase family protein [Lewinella sp. JB7]
MGKTENLFSREAIEKIKKIATDEDITMFCTNLGARPFSTTPMSTQQVEDDGSIWFFSAKDSDRNADLQRDPEAQLIYSSTSDQEYLSLYGEARVVYNLDKAKELWSPMVKTWFQEGPSDPNLSLIHFKPKEGYYWDTQHGKVVAFAKMAASVVSGKTMDDGVSGKISV